MSVWLTSLFFSTAIMYASVGFGGGSTYSALLVLSGIDYKLLPAIALSCNIVVVTGGCLQFALRSELPVKAIIPFLITSVPCAWIGGRLDISETIFVGLLAVTLLLAGARLATQPPTVQNSRPAARLNPVLPFIAGGTIGFISGLVGIGGGIFLAPILYFFNWDTPRRIAAACCLFILVNSISGLFGQVTKLSQTDLLAGLVLYWPLLVAVFIGGQIGSFAASKQLSPQIIKKMTAILILFVSARLFFEWVELIRAL